MMKKDDILLSEYSVAVIGCGGLGCNASVHLAGMGIKKMLLIDFDVTEKSNLNRQFFYSEDNIGESKCKNAAAFLKNYQRDGDYKYQNLKIKSEEDLSCCDGYDIILCCTDNAETRLIINEYCIKKSIPCVNGAIDGNFGTAYLFVPKKSPCLYCAGLTQKTKKAISISSVAGIIGALEASLATEYLKDKNTNKCGQLYVQDELSITNLPIKHLKACPFCK